MIRTIVSAGSDGGDSNRTEGERRVGSAHETKRQIRLLSAEDVRRALPMAQAITAMRLAFGQYSAAEATVPLRSRLETPDGVTLVMPACMHRRAALAVKVVSVFAGNPQRGLPAVTATVLVLDPQTGLPCALLEGDSLTALRTGAAGGLAADLLARKAARHVALFGAGVQGRAQLQAVLAVRPIEQVTLVAHRSGAARRLAEEIHTWPQAPRVQITSDPRSALQHADIVLAATNSATPIFDGRDLLPGTHITGVGSFTSQMQEIDAVAVQRSRVVVDSRQGCLAEAGDIIRAGNKIDAELGEIVNGTAAGRSCDEEITFFKSVGLAAQDAVAAAAVLDRAAALGLGTLITL
jgi:ornithine cyclodeaminase/alanine dehydrogenase-like protein (mu-crystallin family)